MPEVLYDLTPAEVEALIETEIEKKKDDHIDKLTISITQAWYTEMFHRQKKLKPLKNYLKDINKKPSKPKSKDKDYTNHIIFARDKGLRIPKSLEGG